MVVAEPGEREVIDDPAILVAEEGILDLADLQGLGIIGGQPLERLDRVTTPELELAHVAHIEAGGGGPGCPVLLDDAPVLNGHVPAAERDHPRSQTDVGRVEGGPLQGNSVRLTHSARSLDSILQRDAASLTPEHAALAHCDTDSARARCSGLDARSALSTAKGLHPPRPSLRLLRRGKVAWLAGL